MPDVYTAGDITQYRELIYERTTTHVEHWDNAVAQGRHAACAMLGLSQPFVHVPYFFSDVFDLSFEFWGDTSEAVETVTRGDMKNGRFSVWWLGENGRLLAAFIKVKFPINESAEGKKSRKFKNIWITIKVRACSISPVPSTASSTPSPDSKRMASNF